MPGNVLRLRAARPTVAGPREKVTPVRRGVLSRRLFRSSRVHTHDAAAAVQLRCPTSRCRLYSADARSLEPGTVVAGYRIESLVGRGGMGVVYRALQLGLERIVALKVIAPELLDDEDVRARFLAEARAAASVDHPNVIPVHEAGEDDGSPSSRCASWPASDLRSLVRARRRAGPGRGGRLRRPGGARRWTRSTAPASSTATSSPRTCSSTRAATST